MAGLFVWAAGCLMVFFGGVFLLSLRRDIGTLRRLRRGPTPVADITAPGDYHVRGRAVASAQGTVNAPLSKHEVLLYRVLIIASSGGGSASHGSHAEDIARGQVEFLVEDDSGRSLLVDATDSTTYLDEKVIFDGRRPFSGDAPPEILEWTTQRLGHPRDNVTVDERVIEPGLQLSVFGPVSFDGGPQADQLPRMSSPTEGALIISSSSVGTDHRVVRHLVIAAALLVLGHGAVVVSCAAL